MIQCPDCFGTGEEPDHTTNDCAPIICKSCRGEGKVPLKCPECLGTTTQAELDMFGGSCEECTNSFQE